MWDTLRRRLQSEGQITLSIRVRPNAKETRLVDMLADGSVKIDIKAPPQENKANFALLQFVSSELGVPLHAVRFIAGQKSRAKVVCITDWHKG